MGSQLGSKGKFVSEINITPFVDVMLVLLIIFMVTVPMMQEGIELDLPQAKEVEELPSESENLVVSIQRDGTVYIDSYKVDISEVQAKLLALALETNKSVFLQADKDVAFEIVVTVMGEIKAAGITNIGIVATPSEINSPSLTEWILSL